MYRVTTIAKMRPGKSPTVMESRELGLEFFLPESGAGRSRMTWRDLCIEKSECQLGCPDLIARYSLYRSRTALSVRR